MPYPVELESKSEPESKLPRSVGEAEPARKRREGDQVPEARVIKMARYGEAAEVAEEEDQHQDESPMPDDPSVRKIVDHKGTELGWFRFAEQDEGLVVSPMGEDAIPLASSGFSDCKAIVFRSGPGAEPLVGLAHTSTVEPGPGEKGPRLSAEIEDLREEFLEMSGGEACKTTILWSPSGRAAEMVAFPITEKFDCDRFLMTYCPEHLREQVAKETDELRAQASQKTLDATEAIAAKEAFRTAAVTAILRLSEGEVQDVVALTARIKGFPIEYERMLGEGMIVSAENGEIYFADFD
jgi:hypothetical protein